jgi:hypothetical protein
MVIEIMSTTVLCFYVIIGCGVAWFTFTYLRKKRADYHYGCKVSGVRSGDIAILAGGRKALAGNEIGWKVDFIVYGSSMRWADGAQFNTEDHIKVVHTLKKWSTARGSSLKIADDSQSETSTK